MTTNFNFKTAATRMTITAAFALSLFIPQFAHAACAVQAASALPYSVPASGASGVVMISAPAGCPWIFTNRGISWIQILSATRGTGSAAIYYRILPNTGRYARSAPFGPINDVVTPVCNIGGRSVTCGPSVVSTGFTISVYQP